MATVAPITALDFERIATVLGPCELVRGEVQRMTPGGIGHSSVTLRVAFALESWNQRTRRGRVLTNEAGVVVAHDPDTVRGADALFISYERLPAAAAPSGYLTVPPELVVEVLARDESWSRVEQKVAEYHAFGVDLVWVADPQTRSVRVYPRGQESSLLPPDGELDGGALLPGFRCSLAELFATA
jgi:Uma2 family endonuclease